MAVNTGLARLRGLRCPVTVYQLLDMLWVTI